MSYTCCPIDIQAIDFGGISAYSALLPASAYVLNLPTLNVFLTLCAASLVLDFNDPSSSILLNALVQTVSPGLDIL